MSSFKVSFSKIILMMLFQDILKRKLSYVKLEKPIERRASLGNSDQ